MNTLSQYDRAPLDRFHIRPDWGIGDAIQDITERKRVEQALRRSEERYALAACGANDGLWDWDRRGNRVYFSPRWKEMLGHSDAEIDSAPEEWLGRVHPDDRAGVESALAAHLAGETSHFEYEYRIRHQDGDYRWVLCRGLAVRDSDGQATRIAGSQTDITQRRRAEEQLIHDAFHDGLTELPNRALFTDRLEQALKFAQRHPEYAFAVVFLDLDRFKVINDSLGHIVGDSLLMEASRRLRACVRAVDTVARLGGDEFTVLFDDIKDAASATRFVERIQQALSGPFSVGGHEVVVSASMGITLSATGYSRPEDMLRDADTAMYRAKSLGRARYEIFDADMHTRAVALLQIETELRAALHKEEFRVHYQPIVALADDRLIGFEALIRWQHPLRRLLAPGEFLEVAEETGLIVPIGDWVLREACRQMRAWCDRWPQARSLFVAVNLSSKEFAQADLVDKVERVLADTGLDPACLELEMAETVLIENTAAATQVFQRLRNKGVRLSIDDFGTGYSSLSYLHRFPFNTLKIDRSFVTGLGRDRDSRGIVQAIVTLAHNLGMNVIAEGGETVQQVEQLRALACEYGQGYLFSRPVDNEAAAVLIAAGTAQG